MNECKAASHEPAEAHGHRNRLRVDPLPWRFHSSRRRAARPAHPRCRGRARFPEDVRDWLLYDTDHVFIGGSGQGGEFSELRRHPSEMKDGLITIRIVFLSEQLADMPKDDALWTVAHQIAHSRLNHGTGGFDAEVEADRLAQEWGFKEPQGRAAERERYK